MTKQKLSLEEAVKFAKTAEEWSGPHMQYVSTLGFAPRKFYAEQDGVSIGVFQILDGGKVRASILYRLKIGIVYKTGSIKNPDKKGRERYFLGNSSDQLPPFFDHATEKVMNSIPNADLSQEFVPEVDMKELDEDYRLISGLYQHVYNIKVNNPKEKEMIETLQRNALSAIKNRLGEN